MKHKVYFSNLLPNGGYVKFKEVEEKLKDNGIEVETVVNTKDIWMRDYMPIQLDKHTFVTYRYKPDYLCTTERKKYITDLFYTKQSLNEIPERNRCQELYGKNVEIRECKLILDGGNVVLSPNKVILTDKVFFENRPLSIVEVINELHRVFKREVIIIPSDPYEIEASRKENELALSHADGVVAVIDDDTILIGDYGKDEKGYVAELERVLKPHFKNIKKYDFGRAYHKDVWVYINFLRVGNTILLPQLDKDDKDDDECCFNIAKKQLSLLLPEYAIIGINTNSLSLGKGEKDNPENNGGSLHCISWDVCL